MSAPPSRPTQGAGLAQFKPKTRGFLHIVRHGAGPGATYVVTYHRLDREQERTMGGTHSRPMLAEGPQPLIDLLEHLGVDFRRREMRDALSDILRFGSANIPDLWFSDEEIAKKGLLEN